ncbi:hypothetical protein GPECTOR_1g144 [Gonium pectorale]|uniref:Uncharacterized protein n=1 Tax=Gonium pectorale TaxID=33097 RepID=A0A150H2V0_GONPE|nr:hypothetical protein GPECTOR_1g144 [Gonium pectorale]|eukprot:KXZ56168.1 hypothetical protein GPECTOR_1g144 [Gonium pectorale]
MTRGSGALAVAESATAELPAAAEESATAELPAAAEESATAELPAAAEELAAVEVLAVKAADKARRRSSCGTYGLSTRRSRY